MAVESKKVDAEDKAKTTYPCLKQVIKGQEVVLFIGPKKGFVTYPIDKKRPLGFYSEGWKEDTNFVWFGGDVTLRNP